MNLLTQDELGDSTAWARTTFDAQIKSLVPQKPEMNNSVQINYKLPASIYEYKEGFSQYFTLGSTRGKPKVKCTFLIMCLFWVNFILNCSYGICAPFLPLEADKHNIDQGYLGIMFCIYSITMAAMSPVVGKYQYQFGRRNMSRWGMLIVGIPFLGFYLNNYSTSGTMFIAVFMLMRAIQGIGTSMVQTSAYAMLTLTYPQNISFVVGCLETSAGLGLSFGPVIGTILYEFGGLTLTFLSFCVLCTFIGLVIKNLIPDSVDNVEDDEAETEINEVSYTSLLSNRRILFANMCVFLAVFQYAFIDPLLANYMNRKFGIGYETSGYFFLALGLGYTLSCFLVHITSKHVTNMRISIISAILLGIFTMGYGASNILQLSPSMVSMTIALLLAGFANSHLVIPPMDEMINVGSEDVSIYL